nr:MAG TPA: hypothetical protein [Caudoviricetes sp.]
MVKNRFQYSSFRVQQVWFPSLANIYYNTKIILKSSKNFCFLKILLICQNKTCIAFWTSDNVCAFMTNHFYSASTALNLAGKITLALFICLLGKTAVQKSVL